MRLTVEDRLDIQDLMARYSRAIDFGCWEELPGFFTEDCTLDFGKVMGSHRGRDGVHGFAKILTGTGLTMRHYVTNCIIDGDDVRARLHGPDRQPDADDGPLRGRAPEGRRPLAPSRPPRHHRDARTVVAVPRHGFRTSF